MALFIGLNLLPNWVPLVKSTTIRMYMYKIPKLGKIFFMGWLIAGKEFQKCQTHKPTQEQPERPLTTYVA